MGLGARKRRPSLRYDQVVHDLWVGLIEGDRRYHSTHPQHQRSLLSELLRGGFARGFIRMRLPRLATLLPQHPPTRPVRPKAS
jgi:hypothetical protein